MDELPYGLETVIRWIPLVSFLAFLMILIDKTGKIGVIGSLITLLVSRDNYEVRYQKDVTYPVKIKILHAKNIFLSFYIAVYVTTLIIQFISDVLIRRICSFVLPSVFFLLIYLFIWRLIPQYIAHMETEEAQKEAKEVAEGKTVSSQLPEKPASLYTRIISKFKKK